MRRWAAVLLLLGGATSRAEEAPAALSLRDCFRRAAEKSETLALGETDVRQVENQYALVRAGVLPQVGFRASETWQDASGRSDSSSNPPRVRRSESGFYGRQTLFAGFREFAGMRAQSALRDSRQWGLARARQLLYADVAEVYYTVLAYDADRMALTTLGDLTDKRIADLTHRVRIGRSREGERLSVRSQRATLEARRRRAEGLRSSALEVLSVLVGETVLAVAEEPGDLPAPEPVARWMEKLPARPDLAASERSVEAARFLYRARRREIWPSLVAAGNYYTQRSGGNAPIDWDATLSLDLPLFRGGAWRYGVRVAADDAEAARWRLARDRRSAESELRARYAELLSARSETEALLSAAELAEANYNAQVRDYGLGLVTNLDVLTAMDTFQEAKLSYDRRRLDARLGALRVAVAAGDVPEAAP
ncbi:MAG: TolC family protein [Elusimicrobia bacterium]|nr:TolC family protein [Elusimicrobiota bacterium]